MPLLLFIWQDSSTLPEISTDQLQKLEYFYQILCALYVNPKKQKNLAESLFQNKKNFIALCATYNFRRYRKPAKNFPIKRIHKRLLSLMEHPSPQIQAKAFEIFWNFRSLSKWNLSEKDKFLKKIWLNYSYLIPKFLRRSSCQYAVLRTCIVDHHLWKFIQNRVSKKDKTIQNLHSLLFRLTKSPKKISFWAAIAITLLNKEVKIERLIKDSKIPFYLRINVFFSAMYQKLNKMIFIQFIQNEIRRKIYTKDDRLFVQMLLVTVGYFSHELKVPLFEYHLIKALKSKNQKIQEAAITGLLWAGKYKRLKIIKSYLKSKDLDMRRAASSSLSGIYMRHKSNDSIKISKWNQWIRKNHPKLCKSAALGYYILIRSDIRDKLYSILEKETFQKYYEGYLQTLEYISKRRKKQWSRKSKRWLKILKNANKIYPLSYYSYEKGLLHYFRKEYKLAVQNFRIALEQFKKENFSPSKAKYQKRRILLGIAKAYFHLKKFKEALTILEKARKMDPFHPEIYLYLAKIYEVLKDYKRVMHYYGYSFLKNPEDPTPMYELVKSCLKRKERKLAFNFLKLVHQMCPKSKEYLKQSGFSPKLLSKLNYE